ncbi:hypothetical protein ABK040_010074 [Willaertia magna]
MELILVNNQPQYEKEGKLTIPLPFGHSIKFIKNSFMNIAIVTKDDKLFYFHKECGYNCLVLVSENDKICFLNDIGSPVEQIISFSTNRIKFVRCQLNLFFIVTENLLYLYRDGDIKGVFKSCDAYNMLITKDNKIYVAGSSMGMVHEMFVMDRSKITFSDSYGYYSDKFIRIEYLETGKEYYHICSTYITLLIVSSNFKFNEVEEDNITLGLNLLKTIQKNELCDVQLYFD